MQSSVQLFQQLPANAFLSRIQPRSTVSYKQKAGDTTLRIACPRKYTLPNPDQKIRRGPWQSGGGRWSKTPSMFHRRRLTSGSEINTFSAQMPQMF